MLFAIRKFMVGAVRLHHIPMPDPSHIAWEFEVPSLLSSVGVLLALHRTYRRLYALHTVTCVIWVHHADTGRVLYSINLRHSYEDAVRGLQITGIEVDETINVLRLITVPHTSSYLEIDLNTREIQKVERIYISNHPKPTPWNLIQYGLNPHHFAFDVKNHRYYGAGVSYDDIVFYRFNDKRYEFHVFAKLDYLPTFFLPFPTRNGIKRCISVDACQNVIVFCPDHDEIRACSPDAKLLAKLRTGKRPVSSLVCDTVTGSIIFAIENRIYCTNPLSWLVSVFQWTPENHRFAPSETKKVVKTLLMLRNTAVNSAWYWMPNELIFVILDLMFSYESNP